MTWNFDITSAPRGKEVITKITVDGKERMKREHHVDPVWLALESGEVIRSYWIPESKTTGQARWSGMNPGGEPMAWQPFIVPEHPGSSVIIHRHTEINLTPFENAGSGA